VGAATVVATHVEESSGPKLDEANIVVSGGRGLGEAAKYEMIEQLAKLLKGAAGASRAIVDAGWVPYSYQVGQTGKVVKPGVYIACGISGATQHMVGMKGAKNIIAINKDKEAPIFGIADLGIVGDVHKVLPKLIEALQARYPGGVRTAHLCALSHSNDVNRLPGGSYWRWSALALVVAFVVVTVGQDRPAVVVVVVGLPLLLVTARLATVGVYAEDDHLLVRNLFTTRRLPYGEIDEIRASRYPWTRQRSATLVCRMGGRMSRLSGSICYSRSKAVEVADAYEGLGRAQSIEVAIDRDELRSRWL
jgi:hypothetical protein